MKLLRFVLAFGLVVPTLFATEIDLVKITAQNDPLPSYMYIVTNENSDIVEFGKKDLDAKGRIINKLVFPPDINDYGVVLKKKKGKNIVLMTGHNLGPIYGGGLEVNYLYNGITGTRRVFDMELVRSGNKWSVEVEGIEVNHLHFKLHWKRFFGVVGIKRVEIIK